MFTSSNRNRDASQSASAVPALPAHKGKPGMFSVLGPDVIITGGIVATADLHIDGRIEGDVTCATLTQGAESTIVGRVTAESARLCGTIEGSVHVRQVAVERSARICGDIEYEGIAIENGGQVDGALRRRSPGTIAAPATAATPAIVEVEVSEEPDRSPPTLLSA